MEASVSHRKQTLFFVCIPSAVQKIPSHYRAIIRFFSYICASYLYESKKLIEIMVIAVDFDGTIVEHRYPEIGREIPFAIDTLRTLQREGHRLILWSVREDKLLDDAIEFCRQRGLEFYAVNTNYPEEKTGHEHFSRKLKADVFIDDRNLGGLFDWGTIYRIIHYRIKVADLVDEALSERLEQAEEKRLEKKKKQSLWRKLFG